MTARPGRRVLLGGLLGGSAAALAPAAHAADAVTLAAPTVAVCPPDAHWAGIAISRALFRLSGAAVVVRASALTSARATAIVGAARLAAGSLHVPLLHEGPALRGELVRLGVGTVVAYPDGVGLDAAGARVVAGPSRFTPGSLGLPTPYTSARPNAVALLPLATPVPWAALACLRAAGVTEQAVRSSDPRADNAVVALLRARPTATVLGFGAVETTALFADRIDTARRAALIPGGGVLPFPARRMVALYGHPQTRALGLLGEQGISASVARARTYAAAYDPYSPEPVVPAFEIIATVAQGSAGADGSYSYKTPLSILRPWVDAARAAGIYCILDLQPGRQTLLTQARVYESLLREPHVGLAIDPEWRLQPGQLPLQQIGHVDIAEVNEVGTWLNTLTRSANLPPKVLTLHQFQTQMIRNRERLNVALDDLQWLVHVDGQGGQAAKRATWNAIRSGLPAGVRLGWKNFIDEDQPMLTPAQTWAQVSPHPDFISYQ